MSSTANSQETLQSRSENETNTRNLDIGQRLETKGEMCSKLLNPDLNQNQLLYTREEKRNIKRVQLAPKEASFNLTMVRKERYNYPNYTTSVKLAKSMTGSSEQSGYSKLGDLEILSATQLKVRPTYSTHPLSVVLTFFVIIIFFIAIIIFVI